MGWKTIYIDEHCNVSLSMSSLKVKLDDDYISVPLQDIQTVVFAHDKMTITLPIINALIENNVGIIVTNKSKDPSGIFLPFNNHSVVFKQLKQQLEWKKTRKKKLWKLIIQDKIASEIELMKLFDCDDSDIRVMDMYNKNVENGDASNREGIAARLYFQKIFGEDFIRHQDDVYNFALDYGYKIVASIISRYIASRGYLVQYGINHIGESNPFNLTYDFIEVFRIFVDYLVLTKIEPANLFSMEDRINLVDIGNYMVRVNNKKYRLSHAIEMVIDSYFSFLEERSETILQIEYKKLYEFKEAD
ncbi:MAG: type II CRISPR-associated endonuclease Cas1 [Anaerorhabdus sp.]